MLRSLKEIMGYRIAATDGDLGKVADFYFDDVSWCIRYVVVRTGGGYSGRQVLISPLSVGLPDHAQRTLPVALTVKQVAGSPPIGSDLPVSRQHEIQLAGYYNWLPYWEAQGAPMIGIAAANLAADVIKNVDRPGDLHLRSVGAVSTYFIHAKDKALGHVVDFIAETEGWRIRYMVASTRDFLPGKKILVSPDWLKEVDWFSQAVHVNLTYEQFKGCEGFDPSVPVNREVETRLYDFYGRPRYWDTSTKETKPPGA